MKNPDLELLVYSDGISKTTPELNYEGVRLEEVITVESSNYLFLRLQLAPDVQPGSFTINFRDREKIKASYSYELLERESGSASREGVNNSDVIYLITPDRFANGDPSNDEVETMKEGINREEPFGRHGGDIQGMIDHLDYLAGLGLTGIWLNPVLENDMARSSYHGYSTTDFYKVDPRFGSNDEYRLLSDEMKKRDMKLIMDMIVNHCGSEHWWIKDPPGSDWINFDNSFVQTNHVKSVIQDPYASDYDKKRLLDGWFVRSMPDLNQRNEHMANYLIQNSIWWVERIGLAGIRMDTWPYSDKEFLSDWSCAVLNEYPDLLISGEEWSNNPNILSYWQAGQPNKDGYSTCLPSLLDFPLQSGLSSALSSPDPGWGLIQLYEALANDFIYANPLAFVTFPDNHDMDRIYTQVGENLDKFKNAMAFVLTVRGTPQIYYGTELLFTNAERGNHGLIRKDYPGGWDGDKVNAFTDSGLSADQKEAREFITTINTWRKDAQVIHEGKTTHFSPFDNVYIMVRYLEDDMVLCVINRNQEDRTIDISRLAKILDGKTSGTDIISGQSVSLDGSLLTAAGQPMIIEMN